MWKYIFSLCTFFAMPAFSQNVEQVMEDVLDLDTLPKYQVQIIQASTNLFRLGENLLSKVKTSREFQLEVGIHKFQLVLDYGKESTNRNRYSMEGNYWRFGFDMNFSAAWEEDQMIGLGLRIAKAKFSDEVNISRMLPDNTEQLISLVNKDLQASWAELIFKIRGQLSGRLNTGYTIRYQVFQNYKNPPLKLRPFDIPGYGKTTLSNSVQFDFYLGWRLSFK